MVTPRAVETSEIISETDGCEISIISLRDGKPKAGPPRFLQEGCQGTRWGRRETEALARAKKYGALSRSRQGRETEVPRYPEHLSVWFGKTQGRIYIRTPRPGCFHVACSLGFAVLNPGEILHVTSPAEEHPQCSTFTRCHGAAGMRVLRGAQSPRETESLIAFTRLCTNQT